MGKWRDPGPGGLFKVKDRCQENEGRKDTEELEVVVRGRITTFNICEMLGHRLQRV